MHWCTLYSFRRVLDQATRFIGCGINPAKSEIVMNTEMIFTNKLMNEGKSRFTWLGYSLELSGSGRLCFTTEKILSKKFTILHYTKDIFQYAPELTTKRKIFMVYISPIIDYYIPSVIQNNWNKDNCLTKLQHQLLCDLAGVPITASRLGLERALNIVPVDHGCRK